MFSSTAAHKCNH